MLVHYVLKPVPGPQLVGPKNSKQMSKVKIIMGT